MDRNLIDEYGKCGDILRQAVAGLTPEELQARPGPGNWSILELVIHLVDSDSISIDRMKRMLIEDNPQLLYADETAYVERLFTHQQSLADAPDLFAIGRRQWARALRLLPEEAFEPPRHHNRRGRVTVGHMVADYIEHVNYHRKFLHEKRQRLNRPLTSRPS